VNSIAARRRHPLATAVLLLLGLIVTGCVYAAVVPGKATAAEPSASDVKEGRELFLANCSSCHGINAQGRNNAPTLVGVGAASVDFQVSTGRMPAQALGVQVPEQMQVLYTPEQIRKLAAYVASLGPGPDIPTPAQVDPADGNASSGAAIFRTNCAMCHNFAGSGGALTNGKYAPSLEGSSPEHIYEAMVTGPQSMPVFNDQVIDEQGKRDVIAYLKTIQEAPNPGGLPLGAIGPVSEGLVAWAVGLVGLIGCAVWLGAKSS